MSHLCPNCLRAVYSSNLTHCGYCGTALPSDLFAEDYLDDKFTSQTAMDELLLHLERVLDILRRSGSGCTGSVDEVENYRTGLCSEDDSVRKQAIVSLAGRCHHQALGDANTIAFERYHHEVYELWLSCRRVLRMYDKQAA